MQQELVTLRQRVHQLEKALSSASRSIKEQYGLWIHFRQTEQALRESQHQFSFLIQRHPLAVITWNTAFEVTDWNPAAEAIFGYSRCEVLGKHGAELVPENAREQVNQILTALLGQNGGIRSTNENLTKDGKIITCQWYNIALIDMKGKVTGAISMVEDITVRKEMELALSRNEARYRKLVANVPGTIYQFRLEPDGTPSFTYLSEGCRELYGIEPEEAQQNGTLLMDSVHPDESQAFLDSIAISAQTLQKWDWEGRIASKSGQWKWIRGISRPELDQSGAIVWDGLLIDVSDRKEAQLALEEVASVLDNKVIEPTAQLQQEICERQQAENELRRSQQLLQLIFDTLPQRVFWKDKNFKYLGCNKLLAKDAGLESPEEIIGKDDFELPWKEIAHLYRADDIATIENNCSKIYYEELQQREDGTYLWLKTSKTPLHNEFGEVIGVFGCYEDISDHRKAEVALAESEAKFRNLVENAHDVIYSLSIEGKFTYLSPNFTDMFGYDLSALKEQSLLSLLHPDDLSVCTGFLQHICETGEKQAGLEVRMKRRDDSFCWITSNISPIKDADSQVVGFQGVMRDITERKQAEVALRQFSTQLKQQALELEQALNSLQRTQSQLIHSEKMSSLGQLVAGVAHEINNFVNFIYGNLRHAKDYTQDLLNLIHLYQKHYPNPDPEIQEQVEAVDLNFLLQDLPKLYSSMKTGATRIGEIVTSLRTFSRLDQAELKDANIHEGIDSTLMLLEHRLKARPNHPEIKVIKEYGNLPLVECYAGQLNQVFVNILANAIDALEQGNQEESFNSQLPIICIRTEMLSSEDVVIWIADNGPGMSEQVRQRLFDPFYTTKPVGKGTGMGLSISYQIVTEQHGGSLQCISFPQKGADFAIAIPIRQKFPQC